MLISNYGNTGATKFRKASRRTKPESLRDEHRGSSHQKFIHFSLFYPTHQLNSRNRGSWLYQFICSGSGDNYAHACW
jgi:hypothetical protein